MIGSALEEGSIAAFSHTEGEAELPSPLAPQGGKTAQTSSIGNISEGPAQTHTVSGHSSGQEDELGAAGKCEQYLCV